MNLGKKKLQKEIDLFEINKKSFTVFAAPDVGQH